VTDSKTKRPTLPFDPFAMARSAGDLAWGLAAKPAELLEVQIAATRQWSEFWTSALAPPAEPPRDRRFAAPEWNADPYYRAIRDT